MSKNVDNLYREHSFPLNWRRDRCIQSLVASFINPPGRQGPIVVGVMEEAFDYDQIPISINCASPWSRLRKRATRSQLNHAQETLSTIFLGDSLSGFTIQPILLRFSESSWTDILQALKFAQRECDLLCCAWAPLPGQETIPRELRGEFLCLAQRMKASHSPVIVAAAGNDGRELTIDSDSWFRWLSELSDKGLACISSAISVTGDYSKSGSPIDVFVSGVTGSSLAVANVTRELLCIGGNR